MSGLRRLFQTARERNSLTWMDIYWQGGLYALQSGRWLLKRFFFPRNLFDLKAFAVQYVSGLCLPSRVRVQLSYNGRVRVVHLRHFSGLRGFGSHFQIKHGSGSVPCSIFTGLFGYEFLDPWRPLLQSLAESCALSWAHLRVCSPLSAGHLPQTLQKQSFQNQGLKSPW